jgi:metal-responsive CopG/Arc/MetJ family transcriptional regulator
MNENNNELKQRVVAWLYPDMIKTMEAMMQEKDMKNHTEFVSQAVDFYIGYLSSQNSTAFLSQNLLGAIQGTLQNTENRVANNLFRLSVEISMMMHLLATTLEVTDDELRDLRGRCVAEVKKTRGKIKLDDAVQFQQGAEL